jgi:HAD superfamily hydrolase (TIGR01509 family)
MLRALIWDVDGTLAETERDGHRIAFNAAFTELGVPWYWSVPHYGELLHVTGGFERLLHDMASRDDAPADPAERNALARALHQAKNRHYARYVEGGTITLRSGVRELIDDCAHSGVRLAIATTTSRSNLDALMQSNLGGDWARRFASVACAEDAPQKKPHPQVYELTLARLGVPPEQTVAIEDAPNGCTAARAAGVPVVVTPSEYFPLHDAERTLAIGPSLGSPMGWSRAPTSDKRVTLSCIDHWLAMAGKAH